MKNKIKLLILIFFIFMIMPISVSADPISVSNNLTCSDVNATIDEYQSTIAQIENINCDNTTDNAEIKTCNNVATKKAYLLSKLFKMHDDMPKCGGDVLDSIIKENEDECHSVLDSSIKEVANNALIIFYIIAPFLVIIFGSIDFTKMVVTQDPRQILRLRKNFVRRLVAMVMVYLIPLFMNFIISFNMSNSSLDGNVYACNRSLNYSVDTWETTYIPNLRTTHNNGRITVNSQGVQAMMDAAKQLNQKFIAEHWTYGACSGSNIEHSVNCPSKQLVCADLIAQVLYLGNIFTEEQINSTKYNGCCGLYHFLIEQGWQEITNYDDLQAGDVCFFNYAGYSSSHGGAGEKWYSKHTNSEGKHVEYGHTALYAGDDTWFDTGSDSSIVRPSPYKDSSYHRSTFSVGLRMP